MERAFGWRAKLPIIAYAVVIPSLIALAILPVLMVHRLTTGVQENTSTFIPARRFERELTSQYQRKIAELRGLLLSGDRRYLESYRNARAAQE
ncbi:MAG: hypothetical protein ACYC28_03305 [Longimicrobiales bacterium]